MLYCSIIDNITLELLKRFLTVPFFSNLYLAEGTSWLLNFKVADFNQLMIELNKNSALKVVEEVQNIKGWEFFVRRLQDEGHKIFYREVIQGYWTHNLQKMA
jgi:hypothetical protein